MGNALIEGDVCAQFGHPRQAADGLMLEQVTGTEGDACLTRPADHLNGDDRVAAQREEIVVHADVRHAQHRLPDLSQTLFPFRGGCAVNLLR